MKEHQFAIAANDIHTIIMEDNGPRIIDIRMGEDSYKLAVTIRKIIENPELREKVDRIVRGF